MDQHIKAEYLNRIKKTQKEQRENQLYYEVKNEQLKMQKMYLDAVKEIQELKFVQKSVINNVKAEGINFLRNFEHIFHKVQLVAKDVTHLAQHVEDLTDRNEMIHEDLYELRDNIYEFANDLEEHMTFRLKEFDENAQFRMAEFNDLADTRSNNFITIADQREFHFNSIADKRELQYRALADRREKELSNLIDKHKIHLKDYDLKLKDYDNNILKTISDFEYKTSEIANKFSKSISDFENKTKEQTRTLDIKIDNHNRDLKDNIEMTQREYDAHLAGMTNLGQDILRKMNDGTGYMKDQVGKIMNEFSQETSKTLTKSQELYQKIQMKELEIKNDFQGQSLLHDLNQLKDKISLKEERNSLHSEIQDREHKLDLKHLKHVDSLEAEKIKLRDRQEREAQKESEKLMKEKEREKERQQRDWHRELRDREREEERLIRQHRENKRRYDRGEIPKWKWNDMYPDGFHYGI